jgi:PKD repeat protein
LLDIQGDELIESRRISISAGRVASSSDRARVRSMWFLAIVALVAIAVSVSAARAADAPPEPDAVTSPTNPESKDFRRRLPDDPPPRAALVVEPASGNAPLSVVAFAGESSDPLGGALSYRFDFGDGTFAGPQSSPIASHLYGPGHWTLRVTVTNALDYRAIATRDVVVNGPPSAALGATPTTGTAPLAVTLDASGSSDPESQGLTYFFDFGDGAVVGPQSSPIAVHTYATGNWSPRVTVTDASGAAAAASRTIESRVGPKAVLAIAPPSGLAPLSITADASGSSDPAGRPLQYRFDFGDGAVAGPQTAATATHTYSAGHFELRLVVTNDLAAADTAVVAVTGGSPPTAALSASSYSGAGPLSVTLDASGSSDPDGRPMRYWFDFGDGYSIGPSSASTATHVYVAGLWFPMVVVEDEDGATASAEVMIAVNSPPHASLDVSPAAGVAPLTATIDGSASFDPDGDGLVFWFDFGDGSSTGPTPNPIQSHVYPRGTWHVRLVASDEWGALAADTVEVLVTSATNRPPIASLVMDPQTGTGPLAVAVDASASFDPDGAVVSYTFDFGDGTGAGPQPGAIATHVYAPGHWTAHVTVRDDSAAIATEIAVVAVNARPVPALTATPGTGVAPLAITLDARGSRDPEGNTLRYRFDYGDGSAPVGPQLQGVVTHVYAAGLFTATVTVTDSTAAGATASVPIAVDAPPVAAVIASPASGNAPLAVTLNAAGSHDPENGRLTYRFDFGDGSAVVGPQSVASVTHTYAAGRWTAIATAIDSMGASDTASAVINVNAIPVARLVASPSSGTAPLTVQANGSTSTDAEGALTYRFAFGDGVTVGPQSQATATHVYAVGDWTLLLTVTDAAGATDTAAVPVHVTPPPNQPPVAALVATPSSGNGSIAATLNAAGSHDPENGRLTYRFDFGDGSAVVGPQSPASVIHTYAAGRWTAIATAIDSMGASDTASAVINVNAIPVARLVASPPSGTAPLTVQADGSTSTDAEGALTYRFAFGDGVTVGPQSQATATHVYAAGNWTLLLTVTDAAGATDTAAVPLSVRPPNQLPLAQLAATPASGTEPLSVTLSAAGSSDPEGGGLAFRFLFGDGVTVGPQPASSASHTYAQGSWSASVIVTDSLGAADTASAAVVVSPWNQPPVPALTVRLGTLHPDSGFVALITDPVPVFMPPATSRPDYLKLATDPTFGTRVERITDLVGAPLWTSTGGGTWGADARHHYSKDQPWNSDGTLIAMQNSGNPRQVFLDGATYATRYAECSQYQRGDDRWHPSRQYPHVRINAIETELQWWDMSTCTLLRNWDLPFAVEGIGDEEGNPSLDGRFIALCDSTRMFVVDMDPQPPYAPYPNRRIGPVYDYVADCGYPGCRMGWVGISPSGKYVVCKYGEDHPRIFDVNPATLALTPRPMAPASPRCMGTASSGYVYDLGHCDMALNPFDHNEDVLIGQEHCGWRGTVVGGQSIGGVVMARLRDGAITPLTDPGNESYPHHVSTQNLERPGWAYVGYYPDPGKRFSDEIVAIKMDGSRAVQRLAHKHSLTTDCYRCEAHAVPSRDGRRVLWASNWSIECTTCGPPSEIKGYLLDARSDTTTGQSWTAPAIVTADAAKSEDPDGTIASYRFDFGDGAVVGPQAGSVASHTYAAGTWTVQVTVTDDRGTARSTSTTVTIAPPPVDRAPVVNAPPIASARTGDTLRVTAWAVDPDEQPISTLVADLSALPGGNASFSVHPGGASGTLTWVPASTGGPYRVVFTAGNALSGRDTTFVTITNSNAPPTARVTASPASGVAPLAVTLDASTSTDPEGPVSSYLFEFGDGIVVGPQSSPVALHAYADGSWTATVYAIDALGASRRALVGVQALHNWVGNPSFESSVNGWNASGGGTIARVAGGKDGGWSLEMTGPTPPASFGLNDSPNWVSSVPSAGTRFRFRAWVRSASAAGSARLRVREYLNGIQQGATVHSPSVTLAAAWQELVADFTTSVAGSSLDFQVLDAPLVQGEVFQTDLVSIVELPAGAPLVQGTLDESPPATELARDESFEFRATLFPNPPRNGATLRFATERRGPARVELFDVHGRAIGMPLSVAALEPGTHDVAIAGRGGAGFEPGIYFYRVRTVHGSRTGRFAVLE